MAMDIKDLIKVEGADDPSGANGYNRYLYFDHCASGTASGTFWWILSGGSCEGETGQTSAATGPPLGDADACDFAAKVHPT